MRTILLTGGEPRHFRFARAVPHTTHIFRDVNDKAGLILSLRPDVIFVYGTGKLEPPLVRAAPYVLNFHGGDPERYRGLDTNLWALRLRDHKAIQVTLHHVDDTLDTGDIVFQTQLDLTEIRSPASLQTLTTEACIRLATLALLGIASGFLPRRRQRSVGRYYSRMPTKLREHCEAIFRELARA